MALEEKAVELIDKLAVAIEAAAKPATELALTAIRLEAIVYIAAGLLLVAFGIFLVWLGHRLVTKHDWMDDTYMPSALFGGMSIVGGGVAIFTHIIAAINPAAALALRVINTVS